MSRLSRSSLLALAALLVVPATAPAATPGCRPVTGFASPFIARGKAEVTEFFGGGAYRVTECDRADRPLRSRTVALVRTRREAVQVIVADQRRTAALYFTFGDPAEPVWASTFEKALPELKALTPPPTAPRPTERVEPSEQAGGRAALGFARAAAVGDECTNGTWLRFSFGGHWPTHHYSYRARASSIAGDGAWRRAITKGHHSWDDTFDVCNFADLNNVSTAYLGSTSATVHTTGDGASVIDFGSVGNFGCPGALACTRVFYSLPDHNYTETDQRYASNMPWSTSGAAGRYDLWSTSAHESGHSIGLDHAVNAPWLTMYYQVTAGRTYARSLGRGDVRGMRAVYP